MGERQEIVCKKVERLTNGPKHHFFGFHDLIISNQAGDKLLGLEVHIVNRPPLPGEQFGVGYVQEGQFNVIGHTTAMNYPQGARQQWIGKSELFTVNNRVGNYWGTDLYDTSTDLMVERFEASTHMISKDGTKAYGLDYARLFRLGGYGYIGITDSGVNDPVPSNSGITVMDLRTKEFKLLVSVREVAECGIKNSKISYVSHHYLTHLTVNPSSTRIAFLHRYFMADGGMMTRLMTIGSDGSDLRCIAQGFLSHFNWKDDKTIYIFGRANSKLDSLRNSNRFSNPLLIYTLKAIKKSIKFLLTGIDKGANVGRCFIMISDATEPVIIPFAQGLLTEDGHPMTNPCFLNWCANDTYPNDENIRTLMLYNFQKNKRIDLGTFKTLEDMPDMTLCTKYFTGVDAKILRSISQQQLAFTRSGLHCDLHPRWNADGSKVIFDSNHEGTRQIYSVDVESILKQS